MSRVRGSHGLRKSRIFSEQLVHSSLVSHPTCFEKLHVWRTLFHQQVQNIFTPELLCHCMCGNVEAKRPLVNCAPGVLIAHWEVMLVHSHPYAFRVFV